MANLKGSETRVTMANMEKPVKGRGCFLDEGEASAFNTPRFKY